MWSYKPDLPRTTQNILISMNGLVPTSRGGWRPMYDKTGVWSGGASGSTNIRYSGSFLAVNSSGGARVFLAATATGPVGKIWEATGASTLTDRSRAGNYTAGGASYTAYFSFCQLGDVTIAANKSDALQSATTGAFADVSGSPPKAKFCVADDNQVVLLNYNDGTDYPDGWWCSDVGTTTTWTPSASNEAKNGRLRDSGGGITAACAAPFGGVMAFKKNACYIGVYEGQPRVRRWRVVSPKIGCVGAEAAIAADDVVYFVGDDVYMFDGSRVQSITEGVRADIKNNVLTLYDRIALQFDAYNSLLYLFAGTGTNANFTAYYAYHTRTGEWGTGGLNVGILGVLNSSPEEQAAWGTSLKAPNPHWEADAVVSPAYIAALSVLSNAIPTDAGSNDITWTTGYQGDPYKATTVKSITPIFTHGTSTLVQNAQGIPSNVTAYTLAINSYKFIPGGAASGSATATLNSSGRFDLMTQGNWHQATYTVELNDALTEGFEWFDHVPEFQGAGKL